MAKVEIYEDRYHDALTQIGNKPTCKVAIMSMEEFIKTLPLPLYKLLIEGTSNQTLIGLKRCGRR